MRWLIAAVALIAAGVLIWQCWPFAGDKGGTVTDANVGRAAGKGDAKSSGKDGKDAKLAKAGKAGGDAKAPTDTAPANGAILKLQEMTPAAALETLRKGEQHLADKRLAEGRAELSKALLSGKLPAEKEESARKTLSDLADKMLLSGQVFDGDPYTLQYAFQSGDLLAKVERKLELHVPPQLLLRINGMDDARRIRTGQTLKVIRGPFHAIVTKGKFTLDVYLYREGCEPAFIRRLRVGLGKDGATPVGLWRVKLGSKQERANWFTPPNSPVQKAIAWGEPDYPLGKRGLWIGLEGIEDNTRNHQGYGIHGTNDPASIGRSESLGCIRLADADIELIFSLLYEHWSTVRVRA